MQLQKITIKASWKIALRRATVGKKKLGNQDISAVQMIASWSREVARKIAVKRFEKYLRIIERTL